jgi:hypothetical protein
VRIVRRQNLRRRLNYGEECALQLACFAFSEAIAAPAGDCIVISLGNVARIRQLVITLELSTIVNLLRHRITENPSFFLKP